MIRVYIYSPFFYFYLFIIEERERERDTHTKKGEGGGVYTVTIHIYIVIPPKKKHLSRHTYIHVWGKLSSLHSFISSFQPQLIRRRRRRFPATVVIQYNPANQPSPASQLASRDLINQPWYDMVCPDRRIIGIPPHFTFRSFPFFLSREKRREEMVGAMSTSTSKV